MAISTNTEKLAVINFCNTLFPPLPLSPGALGQDDQQQLLWGYPGVLWLEAAVAAITANVFRMRQWGMH